MTQSLKAKLNELFSEDETLATQFMRKCGELPDTSEFFSVSFSLVDDYGGEDQGSDYYTVYEFNDSESEEIVFIKFQGWYASHYGTEYQNFSFVKPFTRTITVYE
jgi:hypothetical protein